MAGYALQARELGINFAVACCGTAVVHIREMPAFSTNCARNSRIWKKGSVKLMSA
jgi:hypothetical protein